MCSDGKIVGFHILTKGFDASLAIPVLFWF